MHDDWEAVVAGLREQGFLLAKVEFAPDDLQDYLGAFLDAGRTELFTFSREWLRSQTVRVATPTQENVSRAFKLNLPPEYMLIHRVWLGGFGVLCQLEATVPFRSLLEQYVPGFELAP